MGFWGQRYLSGRSQPCFCTRSPKSIKPKTIPKTANPGVKTSHHTP
ncbi:hypothetical protein HBZS_104910 [Helicobacter bizzozeronii CCUG 35545]|nr:hypothetical protein HBZS_104910 [Helicobacter bizzozeronii CCUG 35545]